MLDCVLKMSWTIASSDTYSMSHSREQHLWMGWKGSLERYMMLLAQHFCMSPQVPRTMTSFLFFLHTSKYLISLPKLMALRVTHCKPVSPLTLL